MKISFILLILSTLAVSATESYSQETKLTLKLKDATIIELLNEIGKKSEFSFWYKFDELSQKSRINLSVKNQTVRQILDRALKNQDLTYEIKDKVIIIYKSPVLEPTENNAPEVRQRKITGTVLDASTDEPIIGANVYVEGTTEGVVTDISGAFSLNIPEKDAVIVISFLGYIPERIELAGQTALEVLLVPEIKKLDEVVVVGYGRQKKSDLTGSIIRANIKDFSKSPNTNAIQSLQGTVPGLNVGQVTSAGSTPSISIRGSNTLSGNSSILIVLDGIIYNSSLSSINPADIESVDILKDASATAIYGAQAANGVLLITTKKGNPGKTKISYSSSYSVSNPSKDLRPMNRSEYLSFVKDFFYEEAYTEESGYTVENPDFDLASHLAVSVMRDDTQSDGISPNDYDWWGEGTRTGSIFENRVNITGGNKAVSYLFSLANTKQKNYILNDNFERNSIRVNLDAKPVKWWKAGIQSFGSFVNQDGSEPNLRSLRIQSPLITPYDENGDLNPYPFNTLDTNPFIGSDVDDRERHNYFFANIYSEIQLPLKGLTYRINFGNNYRIDEHDYFSEYDAGLTGSGYKTHSTYYDYTFDNIVNYQREFGNHKVGATFVYGAIERKYSYTKADADGFSRTTLSYNSLELGTNQYTYSDAWDEALLYQMFRTNYKYDNKYLITATLRRDGFSGFAENNKTALFPSLALGWVLSEESFINIPFVDHLKVRAGYGISGNQTKRYNSLSKVTTQAGYVFGDGGSTLFSQKLASMQNSDLKWEKTEGINIGLDYTLLGSRLNGSMEYYQTTTKDLLYDVAIPTITGFSSISSNVGEIRNTGVEFTITSKNIKTSGFEWTTTFNISSNSNKIVTLFGTDGDNDGEEDDLVSSGLFIGEPISAIYGYIIDGIYQIDDTDIPAGYNPGNYKIHDANEDGEITTDDRVILGKEDPAYRFGIMNKFKFKGFTFSFFINSIQGGKNGYLGSNSMALYRNSNYLSWNQISEQAADTWSPNNPNATYSRAITSGAIVPTRYQDRSFIRLQDVTLAYDLPKSLLKPIGIESLNIYINGKNLMILTDWKGWDPEANSNYGGRPVMRSFSMGLNVTL